MAEISVSVIIPVFNLENYIRECLDSITGQTLKELQIICVDDGSTDGSAGILKEYADRDQRITVLSQKNKGVSSARNYGVEKAEGKYLYFMDGDDILEKDALRRLYQLCEEKELDVAYFDGESFFETEELKETRKNYVGYYRRKGDYSHVMTGEKMLCEMLKENEYRVSLCIQFLRASFYRQEKLSFAEGVIGEDNIFTFRSILAAKRVYHIKDVLFHRRVRGNSVMTSAWQFDQVRGMFAGYLAVDRVFHREDLSPELREGIATLLNMRLHNARTLYAKLDPEYRKNYEQMECLEKTYFKALVADYEEALQKEKDLMVKYKQVCQDKQERGVEIHTLRREKQERGVQIRELKAELQEQKKLYEKQEKAMKKLETENAELGRDKARLQRSLSCIRKSVSFRLGRLLTKPFRWVKSKIKSK